MDDQAKMEMANNQTGSRACGEPEEHGRMPDGSIRQVTAIEDVQRRRSLLESSTLVKSLVLVAQRVGGERVADLDRQGMGGKHTAEDHVPRGEADRRNLEKQNAQPRRVAA